MVSVTFAVPLYATIICIAFAQRPNNVPLIIPPSGQWDGIDGPWSTFYFGVGEPLQLFRCVPGFSTPVVMLPVESPECKNTTIGLCRDRAIFRPEDSRSWNYTGIVDPSDWYIPESAVPSDGSNMSWGTDRVDFGNIAIQDFGFAEQLVIEITSLDFFVGIFGIGSVGSIVPQNGAQSPTLLSAVAASKAIPSSSFSYTAGSAQKNSTGSLILGGYDTSRFNSSTMLSLEMPGRENTTLIINLESIRLFGQSEVNWPTETGFEGIPMRIDSAQPQIGLPLEACLMFERAFGLEWNDTLQLYIINENTHTALVRMNPSVSFQLGGNTNGISQTFALPYSAFDLQLAPPLVENVTHYFPLKRAANWRQNVLGRVFLQEIYLTVDYERANFSLSQVYPPGGSGYILPISSALDTSQSRNETAVGAQNTGSPTLSPGAYAGIGVGVGLIALISIGLLVSWKKGWGLFRKKLQVPDIVEKPELHGEPIPRVEAMEKERAELLANDTVEAMERDLAELETVEPSQEAGCPTSPAVEGLDVLHELDAEEMRRSASLSRVVSRLSSG